MEESTTIQFGVAIITALGILFGKWQAGKTSGLAKEVELLTERTQKLEEEKIEDRNTIAALRLKIDELHDKLYAALKGEKKKGGIF